MTLHIRELHDVRYMLDPHLATSLAAQRSQWPGRAQAAILPDDHVLLQLGTIDRPDGPLNSLVVAGGPLIGRKALEAVSRRLVQLGAHHLAHQVGTRQYTWEPSPSGAEHQPTPGRLAQATADVLKCHWHDLSVSPSIELVPAGSMAVFVALLQTGSGRYHIDLPVGLIPDIDPLLQPLSAEPDIESAWFTTNSRLNIIVKRPGFSGLKLTPDLFRSLIAEALSDHVHLPGFDPVHPECDTAGLTFIICANRWR